MMVYLVCREWHELAGARAGEEIKSTQVQTTS